MKLASENLRDRSWQLQQHLEEIFTDPNHPEFFFKDIDFARKYNVSRHTIEKIRCLSNIPNRKLRIAIFLKKIKEEKFTIRDLSSSFSVKYDSMYKLIEEFKIPHRASNLGRPKRI